jgi:hypothetical protein
MRRSSGCLKAGIVAVFASCRLCAEVVPSIKDHRALSLFRATGRSLSFRVLRLCDVSSSLCRRKLW